LQAVRCTIREVYESVSESVGGDRIGALTANQAVATSNAAALAATAVGSPTPVAAPVQSVHQTVSGIPQKVNQTVLGPGAEGGPGFGISQNLTA